MNCEEVSSGNPFLMGSAPYAFPTSRVGVLFSLDAPPRRNTSHLTDPLLLSSPPFILIIITVFMTIIMAHRGHHHCHLHDSHFGSSTCLSRWPLGITCSHFPVVRWLFLLGRSRLHLNYPLYARPVSRSPRTATVSSFRLFYCRGLMFRCGMDFDCLGECS